MLRFKLQTVGAQKCKNGLCFLKIPGNSSSTLGNIKSIKYKGQVICSEHKQRIVKRSVDFKCGQSLYQPNVVSRIAGGESFKPGSWPWLSALFYNLKYICGGSLGKTTNKIDYSDIAIQKFF
jgi:hypothetical protein